MNAFSAIGRRRLHLARPTLRLERPFGQTFLLSLILLAVLVGAAELVVRHRRFRAYVVANDRGSAHNQFEVQLGRLENVAAFRGSIDCIFLGNSMVWRGFDPEAFTRAFQEETGRELRCFNFGVDGMPASSAGVLASILVQDFQPRYLIYGTDARDFAVPVDARDAGVLLDSPWLRYRQGHFSLSGWIYEHVHFYRYRQSLGHLLRLEKTYLFVSGAERTKGDTYGFTGDDTVGAYVSSSPLQHLDLGPVQYYRSILSDYRILPEDVRGLQQIAGLSGEKTQVFIVEMPIPETYLEFFGNGEQDYQSFLSAVQEVAAASQIPFWQTRPLQLIPIDGWVDYSHLNTKGARIFSRWFAGEIGALVAASERATVAGEDLRR